MNPQHGDHALAITRVRAHPLVSVQGYTVSVKSYTLSMASYAVSMLTHPCRCKVTPCPCTLTRVCAPLRCVYAHPPVSVHGYTVSMRTHQCPSSAIPDNWIRCMGCSFSNKTTKQAITRPPKRAPHGKGAGAVPLCPRAAVPCVRVSVQSRAVRLQPPGPGRCPRVPVKRGTVIPGTVTVCSYTMSVHISPVFVHISPVSVHGSPVSIHVHPVFSHGSPVSVHVHP